MDDYLESVLQGWIANVVNLFISFNDWINTHPALTIVLLVLIPLVLCILFVFSIWLYGNAENYALRFWQWLHRNKKIEGEE